VTVPHWYIDEGNLDWGYALTGHKAQGATARRAHTVAGDGVDREWLYVTMSRGREANTIYLTDPDVNESECTHLTHQHPDRLPALITALGRTAAEPAALDAGRGPRRLTDEQLCQAIADIETRPSGPAEVQSSASVGGGDEELVIKHVGLYREREDRHRDWLAVVSFAPPSWLVDIIGERPADCYRRDAWDRVASRATIHRADYRVAQDASGLLPLLPRTATLNAGAQSDVRGCSS